MLLYGLHLFFLWWVCSVLLDNLRSQKYVDKLHKLHLLRYNDHITSQTTSKCSPYSSRCGLAKCVHHAFSLCINMHLFLYPNTGHMIIPHDKQVVTSHTNQSVRRSALIWQILSKTFNLCRKYCLAGPIVSVHVKGQFLYQGNCNLLHFPLLAH